jgi:hypothetical protein
VAVYRTATGARRPACWSPSPCLPARHRTRSCTPATVSPGAARHCAFSPCPTRSADTRQPLPRRHRGGTRHASGGATSTDGPHVRGRGTRGERPAVTGGGRGPCSRAAVPQTGVKPCAGRFRPAEDGRGTITSQARSFGRAAAGSAANLLSCPSALTTGHRPSVFPARIAGRCLARVADGRPPAQAWIQTKAPVASSRVGRGP